MMPHVVWSEGATRYELADGSAIVTKPSLPLPQAVVTDVQRRLDAIAPDSATDNGTSAMRNFEAEQAIGSSLVLAGKNAVTIRHRRMAVPNPDGSLGGFRWVATGTQSGWWMQWETDRQTMADKVQQWIAANAAPNTWLAFVASEGPAG